VGYGLDEDLGQGFGPAFSFMALLGIINSLDDNYLVIC
jgi:hypothetical protein